LRESCALLTLSTKDLPREHNPDMSNDSGPLVSIRDMVQRSGVASSTLRYYEKLGLIASEREGSSEHRRYRESTFLKICYITIGQPRRLQPRGNRGATGHLARPIPAAEERLGADVPGMGRAHRPAHRRTQKLKIDIVNWHLRAHEGVCGRPLARSQSRTFSCKPASEKRQRWPAQSAALRRFQGVKAALRILWLTVFRAAGAGRGPPGRACQRGDPLQGPRRRLAPGHGFGWIGSCVLQRIGHAAIP